MQHPALIEEVKKIKNLPLYKEILSNKTFSDGKKDFFDKLDSSIKEYLENPTDDRFWKVTNFFNELLAVGTLVKKLPDIEAISYEKPPTNIDFQIVQGSKITHIEVKSIHPDFKKSLENAAKTGKERKYQYALENGQFPKNHQVIYNDPHDGNEIMQGVVASRQALLDNIRMFEDKPEEQDPKPLDSNMLLVVITAFNCNISHLEDVVFFYRTGNIHSSDSFGLQLSQEFDERKAFKKTIQKFYFLKAGTFFDSDPAKLELLEY